jgi:hypothetical protein
MRHIVFCAVLVAIGLVGRAGGSAAAEPLFEIRGFSYFSDYNGKFSSPESVQSLRNIAATGANWVAVVTSQFTSDLSSANIYADPDGTESDSNVIRAIEDAHSQGLAVLLKPHLDPASGEWRGFYKPADVDEWFRNYRDMIVRYAGISHRTGVEMLSIGCEFENLSGTRHAGRWTEIIKAVRAVYPGPITYAATWAEVGGVAFWDKMDYIGINAYNPLITRGATTVEALTESWNTVPDAPDYAADAMANRSPVAFYREISMRYAKPVILTEVGYRSVTGAEREPGDWSTPGQPDDGLQVRLYEALFQVWRQEMGNWMKGAFLWTWHPHRLPDDATGYTPEGKPVKAVITRNYGG